VPRDLIGDGFAWALFDDRVEAFANRGRGPVLNLDRISGAAGIGDRVAVASPARVEIWARDGPSVVVADGAEDCTVVHGTLVVAARGRVRAIKFDGREIAAAAIPGSGRAQLRVNSWTDQ